MQFLTILFPYTGCVPEKRTFSNFSCMFLNPNNFFLQPRISKVFLEHQNNFFSQCSRSKNFGNQIPLLLKKYIIHNIFFSSVLVLPFVTKRCLLLEPYIESISVSQNAKSLHIFWIYFWIRTIVCIYEITMVEQMCTSFGNRKQRLSQQQNQNRYLK